jgi:hypothetical protein
MSYDKGDVVRFSETMPTRGVTRGEINGGRGEVIAVDEQTRIVATARGTTETLNPNSAHDQHIAHAYVDAGFAAQGRTADHVIMHADSTATNLVDQKVSDFPREVLATIFTNDRGKLVSAINERVGQVRTAIAQAVMTTPTADKAAGLGLAEHSALPYPRRGLCPSTNSVVAPLDTRVLLMNAVCPAL